MPSGQPPCSASTVWYCSPCAPTQRSTRWHWPTSSWCWSTRSTSSTSVSRCPFLPLVPFSCSIPSSSLSSHNNTIRAIWGLFCVSLAAQIGTLPLIVFYFGRISCYSLITSFIAIPAATLILYLCVLLFILSPLTYISFLASPAEGLMQLVINVLTSITQFINTAFRLTSMLPGASIEHVHLSLLQLAILYVAILAGYFAFVKWYRLKEKMV